MKQDGRDHNADYWASRHATSLNGVKAQALRCRIDNLKKLLVRSHTAYKKLIEVYNPPPTGALKKSVKD